VQIFLPPQLYNFPLLFILIDTRFASRLLGLWLRLSCKILMFFSSVHKNTYCGKHAVTMSGTVLDIDNIVPSSYISMLYSSCLLGFRRIYVPKTIDIMRKRTYSLRSPQGAFPPLLLLYSRTSPI
jgi:hypothetical protein